jgi:hypothetical protein
LDHFQPDLRGRPRHRSAERLGIPWCYWDLTTDFGLLDPATWTWHAGLRNALFG